MLPAGKITEETIERLGGLLKPDDIIIDGGNSFYKDDIQREKTLAAKRIRYVDCGTSGGVWGIEFGYCLMIGGPKRLWINSSDLFEARARPRQYPRAPRGTKKTLPEPSAAIFTPAPLALGTSSRWCITASSMRFGFGGDIEGNEPIDPEPKSEGSHGHSMAQDAAD